MKFGIFNLWCAGILGLILVPNLLYAIRRREGGISSGSRAVNALEHTGRFGCMVFMVVPLGVRGGEFGFYSPEELVIWGFGTLLLLAAYYVCWAFFARRPGRRLALALALIPCGIFLLSAVLLRHWVLAVFTGIFTGAHLYIVRHGGPQV